MPSLFLLNAAVLFGGIVAFVIAGFAGTFVRSLHGCRYRLMLAPLGFTVCGGISISAEQHLLRWIEHGHLHHSFGSGLAQSGVLLITGLCGLLAGVGLGASLERTFPDVPSYSIANYWGQKGIVPPPSPVAAPVAVAPETTVQRKVVPISRGRHSGVVAHIKAVSHRD